MWNRFILMILLLILTNCFNRRLQINDPNYFRFNIRYQNLERKSMLFYPENYEKENFSLNQNIRTYPLLISLHGGGGSIDSNIKLTKGRLIELKEKHRFFLLFPEGYDKQWNDGRIIPTSKAHSENIDDVGYLKHLIDYMKKNFPIDPNHIYIFGISNGGMMSFRFACEYSNEISGFASIAATMPAHLKEQCNLKKNLKMILIHGTEDPMVPYYGGDVKVLFRKRGIVLSAEETVQFWIHKNECNKKAIISVLEQYAETKTQISQYRCKNQTFVRFYKINNGGHTWPGGLQYLPEWYIGKTTQNFRAEEEIIKYFLQE